MTATALGLPPQPRHTELVYQALTGPKPRTRRGSTPPAPTFPQLCDRITSMCERRLTRIPVDSEVSAALAWLLLAGAAVRSFEHGERYNPRPFTFPARPATKF